jgi:hypothetical protein
MGRSQIISRKDSIYQQRIPATLEHRRLQRPSCPEICSSIVYLVLDIGRDSRTPQKILLQTTQTDACAALCIYVTGDRNSLHRGNVTRSRHLPNPYPSLFSQSSSNQSMFWLFLPILRLPVSSVHRAVLPFPPHRSPIRIGSSYDLSCYQ